MKRNVLMLSTTISVLAPNVAAAHELAGEAGWDGVVSAGLLLSLAFYGLGTLHLWKSAGVGRGVRARHVIAFLGGWIAIVVALKSPLEEVSEELFSAHMIEHEILMIVAAPLLVAAHPLGCMAWSLPRTWRRAVGIVTRKPLFGRFWNGILHPAIAWSLHAATFWVWHAPALFQAALTNVGLHALQHASFFVAALIYWWSLMRPAARSHRGISSLSLFATSLQTSLLGAVLALSQHAWYPLNAAGAMGYGLTPLEDQQIAGMVMWVPGGLVYLGAALGLLGAMFRKESRRWSAGEFDVVRL
jgi:putative membrane protein